MAQLEYISTVCWNNFTADIQIHKIALGWNTDGSRRMSGLLHCIMYVQE